MAHELEARVVVQVIDVALGTGEEVVEADNLMPLLQQAVAEMRAKETGASGNEDAFAGIVERRHGDALLNVPTT